MTHRYVLMKSLKQVIVLIPDSHSILRALYEEWLCYHLFKEYYLLTVADCKHLRQIR